MSEAKHTPGPWSVDKDMIRAVNPITSIANLMKLEDVKHHCPRCGAELTLVIWGCMWDWDTAECPKCGYDGELDTMTGVDPDGSIWQTTKPEEDE